MAFEPQRSIAGIMTAAGQNWRSPMSSLTRGYMAGQENRRRNEEFEMQKAEVEREREQREREEQIVAQMQPKLEQALGVPPGSLPPGMTMADFKAYSDLKNTTDERARQEGMMRLDSMAGALGSFSANVPEQARPQAWGQYRQQLMQQYPTLAKSLPEQYDPVLVGNMMAQSEFGRDLLKQSQKKALVNFEPGALGGGGYNESQYQKTWSQEQAKGDAKFEQDLYDATKLSSENDYRLNRMEALLNEGTSVGEAAPAQYAISKWMAAVGMNVDPSNQEEFSRISNQLAFDELAKFKGPTSEKELSFAMGLVGNLAGEEGAIRRYILVGRRLNERNRQVQQFYNQRMKETGNNAQGVRRDVAQWMIENPLIGAPRSQEDFNKLKPGAVYVDPQDGKLYMKK